MIDLSLCFGITGRKHVYYFGINISLSDQLILSGLSSTGEYLEFLFIFKRQIIHATYGILLLCTWQPQVHQQGRRVQYLASGLVAGLHSIWMFIKIFLCNTANTGVFAIWIDVNE